MWWRGWFRGRSKLDWGYHSIMATIHIPEAEVARNIQGLIAQARAGVEVIIEEIGRPAVVLRAADVPHLRLLSESLRLAREHGSKATLDGDFGRDLEDAVNSHPEHLENPWG